MSKLAVWQGIAVLFIGLVLGYAGARVEYTVVGSDAPAAIVKDAPAPSQPQPQAPSLSADEMEELLIDEDAPMKGDSDAPLTIVEFSDYQCPFCDRYTADTLPQITSKYIDTGKVKYYFRDYPLGFHPQAKPAAIAASCAGAQGKYWEMHDLLFAKQGEWSGSAEVDQLLATYAADLGLNIEDFEKCSADSSIADEIDEDFAAGAKLGVSGTPSFFINGVKIVGAQPYATFEAAIEKALEN